MNDIARRPEPVKQLAFLLEGLLWRCCRRELETVARANEPVQALAQVPIVSPYALHPERACCVDMAQREHSAQGVRHRQLDAVER
jgi:hypothetical protein